MHHKHKPKPDFHDCHGMSRQIHALVEPLRERRPILLIANPGAGATMIARRIPGVLAPKAQGWFRAPHHSCSGRALAGEARLAMDSVLFLDEVDEFSLPALRSLAIELRGLGCRAPQIIAAARPCVCGLTGSPNFTCVCTPKAAAKHLVRLKQALEILAGSIDSWTAIGLALHEGGPGPTSEEIRMLIACDSCLGRGWLHMDDSCGRGPGIERCDSCQRYVTDFQAAEIHRGECDCGMEVAL